MMPLKRQIIPLMQHIREEVKKAERIGNLTEILADALAPFGVTNLFVGRFLGARDTAADGIEPGHILVHNYSRQWIDLYTQKEWVKRDARFKAVRLFKRPYLWSEIAMLNSSQAEIHEALADYGMRDGLCVPQNINRSFGGLMLSGNNLKKIEDLGEVAAAVSAIVLARSLELKGLGSEVHLDPDAPTLREREILMYVAEGYSNRDIGAACNISGETVKDALARMSKKFGVSGRERLIAYGFRRGFLK